MIVNNAIFRFIGLLLLFFYIYPVFFKFIPVPTDRILQTLGVFVFLVHPQGMKLLADKRILKVIACAIIITTCALWALLRSTVVNFYFVKYTFDICLMLFSAFAIISVFLRSNWKFDFVKLLDALIIVAILQAIISFIFFFNPILFKGYLNVLDPVTNTGLISKSYSIERRLYGIGNQYFIGVTNYGFSLLVLCVIPYLKGSYFHGKRVLFFMSVLIICSAGILSGRTFFAAILLALFFILLQERKRFNRLLFRIIKTGFIIFILGIIFLNVFQSLIDTDRMETIWGWVFELFINYSETGELSSNTTDVMMNMYKLPDNTTSLLIGEGGILSETGGYYMHTDIGYIRMIFYFGIVGLIIYLLIQFAYSRILGSFFQNKQLKHFSFFLFLWVVILNLKGLSIGDPYFILFIVGAVMTSQWSKLKKLKGN